MIKIVTIVGARPQFIKAAAVSDYTPVATSTEKIKKADGTLTVSFQRTTDILKTLGEHKPEHLFLCGFSMASLTALRINCCLADTVYNWLNW